MLGWGVRCEELFKAHANIFEHPFFVGLVGYNAETQLYVRGVAMWIRNRTLLPRVRAGSDRVYVYCALEGDIGPEKGMFRLVPGSHHMSGDEADACPEIDVRLAPGQTLLMDGNMVIRYPQAGGALGMMVVYWKEHRKNV